MAEGRRQFDEAGRGADALQRLDDEPRLGGRIEPVGIEADQSEAHILRPREGPCEGAAVRLGQVKIIHHEGDGELDVGVTGVYEAATLLAEIRTERVR